MEWKTVVNSNYLISNDGQLKNKKTNRIRKNSLDHEGYIRHILSVNGKNKAKYAHRLVAEAFIPNPKNYPIVHHINNIRDDNRVENLMWTTSRYNRDHAFISCPHCGGNVKV